MAYNFVEKDTHKQQENAYILYMIIGSEFRRCICRSKEMETNLLMHYKDMKTKNQEKMEKQVIADFMKALKGFKGCLHDLNCEVIIIKKEDTYYLYFYTGLEYVTATVDKKGHYEINVFEGLK